MKLSLLYAEARRGVGGRNTKVQNGRQGHKVAAISDAIQGPARSPTVFDVAREVGCSIATVLRAINEPGRVKRLDQAASPRGREAPGLRAEWLGEGAQVS
jgi:hypothetical protein